MQISFVCMIKPFYKKCNFFFILLNISILLSFQTNAQNSDTSKIKKHSVQKAAIMSACLPGFGQAYNKKYWKIPVIYTGAATLTYFAVQNSRYYKKYNNAYIIRNDGNAATTDEYEGIYSNESLLELKNYYRRNIELTVICSAALYALNIIDASVDATLFNFDINDDLSLKIHPVFFSAKNYARTGFFLSVRFCIKYKQQALLKT